MIPIIAVDFHLVFFLYGGFNFILPPDVVISNINLPHTVISSENPTKGVTFDYHS